MICIRYMETELTKLGFYSSVDPKNISFEEYINRRKSRFAEQGEMLVQRKRIVFLIGAADALFGFLLGLELLHEIEPASNV